MSARNRELLALLPASLLLVAGFTAIFIQERDVVSNVSLTFGALNRSRCVWFLVNGEGKADAVAQALAPGTDLHDIPAAGVSGEAETIWFLDRGSASQL